MPEDQTHYNLLTDPIFGIEAADGTRSAISLPEVLARLGGGVETEFTGLRSHQQHPWHAFLVQLAAIAVHRDGNEHLKRDAESWRALLRALTGKRDDAWCLVVEDLAQPAFMQPPVPEGSLAKFKSVDCADEIDVLVTTRNHDVKARRMASARPEHWVYALISLQTMQGYLGQYYGVSRMNGGSANRPYLSIARDPGWVHRFTRDVGVWLRSRHSLVSSFGYRDSGGASLLWLTPWDGKTSLQIAACDPLYVEICRRIRLTESDRIAAHVTTSKCARLNTKTSHGNTGDVWTPIHKGEQKSLTVSTNGFSYKVLHEVLFGDAWARPPALEVLPEDGESPVFIARALVRGDGVTEGLHERIIPVPAKVRNLFATLKGRELLGQRAKTRVENVAKVRDRVLKPALLALLQGGPEKLVFKDARASRLLNELDRRVDEVFFEHLFADVETNWSESDPIFVRRVIDQAREILDSAIQSVPLPTARRYRAIAAAERTFIGGAHKQFRDAMTRKGERADEQSSADA